jgi:hypothetical protein
LKREGEEKEPMDSRLAATDWAVVL